MQLVNHQTINNGNKDFDDKKLTTYSLIYSFSELPIELIEKVIENLTLDCLAQTMVVNKKFKAFSEKSSLALLFISDVQKTTHSVYQSCLSGLNKLAFPKQFKNINAIFDAYKTISAQGRVGPFMCINQNIENFDKILEILRTANSYMKGNNKWMEIESDKSVKPYKLLAEYNEFRGESLYLMDNQGNLRVYETYSRLLDEKPIFSKLRRSSCKRETQNKSFVYTSKKCEIECLLKIIDKLPNL
ncbi:MAG: F-box protein [Parachlamydiaceae bacterium]|nr:F-box protein [Parachlamydiaceae bacterium]